jgi:hypothetical protein
MAWRKFGDLERDTLFIPHKAVVTQNLEEHISDADLPIDKTTFPFELSIA